MVMFVFFGPSIFKSSILARTSPNLQGELAQKSQEPSLAELKTLQLELNRAEPGRAELGCITTFYS